MKERPSILVLSHVAPEPIDQGDKVRLMGLIRGARDAGIASLAVWSREVPSIMDSVDFHSKMSAKSQLLGVLRAFVEGRPLQVGPYSAHFPPLHRRNGIVIAYQLKTARWALALPATLRILDLTDSLSLYRSTGGLSKLKKLQLRGVDREEIEIGRKFDLVWLSAEEDLKYLEGLGLRNGSVVPNAPPVMKRLSPGDPRRLLFVGNLGYKPNAHGLDWFLKTIWPVLVQRGYLLDVVGKGSSGLRRQGVNGHGWVPHIEPFYASAGIVISPVRYGTGSQIKIQEALGYGRPVVATRRTCCGNGHIFKVDDSAVSWIEAFDRLRANWPPSSSGQMETQSELYAKSLEEAWSRPRSSIEKGECVDRG